MKIILCILFTTIYSLYQFSQSTNPVIDYQCKLNYIKRERYPICPSFPSGYHRVDHYHLNGNQYCVNCKKCNYGYIFNRNNNCPSGYVKESFYSVGFGYYCVKCKKIECQNGYNVYYILPVCPEGETSIHMYNFGYQYYCVKCRSCQEGYEMRKGGKCLYGYVKKTGYSLGHDYYCLKCQQVKCMDGYTMSYGKQCGSGYTAISEYEYPPWGSDIWCLKCSKCDNGYTMAYTLHCPSGLSIIDSYDLGNHYHCMKCG